MWPGMAGFQQVLTIPRPKYYQSALTANFHEMAFLAWVLATIQKTVPETRRFSAFP